MLLFTVMPAIAGQFTSLFVTLTLLLPVVSHAATVGPRFDASAAYGRGDYVRAMELLLAFALQGDASAQFAVGSMYGELGFDSCWT